MAKKLFAGLFLITVIIFSSIFIYANQEDTIETIKMQSIETETTAMAVTAEKSEQIAREVFKKEQEREKKEAARKEAAEKKKKEARYLKGLAAYIQHINSNVTKTEADIMAESFVKYGKKYSVDEKVVMAIAHNESTYYSDAVSSENFKGLMQTGDGLAENAGYDPSQLFNPKISIKVGAKYLGAKMDEFGDLRLALTAYNQGSGSVHSGNYSTGYADLALERAEAVEAFLVSNGYQ